MNANQNVDPSALMPNAKWLITINLVIAAIILLANGSALILGYTGKAPDVLANLLEVILILISAAVVLATAVFAIVKPAYGQKALSIHAAFLATGAAILLLWGLNLTMQSTNELVNPIKLKVTWSVGWLTALASYSAYLVTNTFLLHARNHSIVVKYAYLWVGAIIFFIDVFVFFRLAQTLGAYQ